MLPPAHQNYLKWVLPLNRRYRNLQLIPGLLHSFLSAQAQLHRSGFPWWTKQSCVAPATCSADEGCCDDPQPTALPDPDCNALCTDMNNISNGCCTAKYCYCGGDGQGWLQECNPPGNLFCKSTGECTAPENCQSEGCCDLTYWFKSSINLYLLGILSYDIITINKMIFERTNVKIKIKYCSK